MDNEQDLSNLAYENGLDLIETTVGACGYPKYLEYAIIGFEDFDEALDFANKNNLDLIRIRKGDGWNLWERQGFAGGPYKLTADYFGDDYSQLESSDYDGFYEREVKPFVEQFKSFDNIKEFLKIKEKIYDELYNIDNDKYVITCEGVYYDTIKKECMSFYYDTYSHDIAAIKKGIL